MKHPMQPLIKEPRNKGFLLRFKKNTIVRYLLDLQLIDLNTIVASKFSKNDLEQFAQLIGLSVVAAADMRMISDSCYSAAYTQAEKQLDTSVPTQPIVAGARSYVFKKNDIVEHLEILRVKANINIPDILKDQNKEDWMQYKQLIGIPVADFLDMFPQQIYRL